MQGLINGKGSWLPPARSTQDMIFVFEEKPSRKWESIFNNLAKTNVFGSKYKRHHISNGQVIFENGYVSDLRDYEQAIIGLVHSANDEYSR